MTFSGRVRLGVLGGRRDRGEFAFAWPIWRLPASLAAITAILSHPDLQQGPAALAYLGVVEVRRTHRIRVDRYANFTRAEAVE